MEANFEAIYRTLFETTPDGIMVLDDEGRFVDVNDSLCRLLQAPRERVIGASFEAFIPTALRETARAGLQELKEQGRLTAEFPLQALDGSRVELEWTARAGFLPGLHFGVVRDITARKQAEKARQESEARVAAIVAEGERRKDHFLAMLAHELRNPLGAISNAVHVLQQPRTDEAARQRATRVLGRQVQHQARIVNELLDVSRITRGLIELRPEPLDLARLVRDVAEDYRVALQQQRIALDVDLPESPVWVSGDPTRLAQVVSNLLSNAVKFTPAGGRVGVQVFRPATTSWPLTLPALNT